MTAASQARAGFAAMEKRASPCGKLTRSLAIGRARLRFGGECAWSAPAQDWTAGTSF